MSPARRDQVPTFCALCVSRCGALATVEDGVMTALSPDPSHPTGSALCIKGRVAPELVNHPRRILHPMERTRPKGEGDPGWRRISWDQALGRAAERLGAIARESGPQAVVWSASSPSTTAVSDAVDWIQRLRRAFGSPNLVASMELCGWGRYLASSFTWGEPVPGVYLPDLDRAGCILFWGYNPSLARLTHATAATRALRRGARLIVVDPRRVGLAHRADVWLRVRPGTDGALALAIAHVMIERGWFDRDFVRIWSNGPFLVRPDDGRLLRASDLDPEGDPTAFVAWDEAAGQPVVCRPGERETRPLALAGTFAVATRSGPLACRPAFALVAELCARHAPAAAEAVTGVAAGDIERAARLLWESRPVAFYAWSGVEQHTSSTQTARAIAQLYALTGCIDAPGGNVRFAAVPTASVEGYELLPAETRARALGLERRPLGAARFEFITCDDFYTAALEGRPYRARGLVGFGANLLVAQPDGRRGRAALTGLDFYLHADLFMNPTAELADIVLPVASCFESEALAVGFEVSPEAQAFVQLRRAVVAPRGEARSDTEIAFALASRLGLGPAFWDGDIDAGLRHRLGPSGLELAALRAQPAGVAVPLVTRHRKYAEPADGGGVRGFATRSGKVELYSESLLAHGQPPLPAFEEPGVSPRSRPDLAASYPLVLTSAKSTWFCESQHRGLPGLRRRALDPQIEVHPDAAAARGIAEGDWVSIETPTAAVRARAVFNPSLEPSVVCGQHGWWQGCEEIGAPAFDPFGDDSANLNLLFTHEPSDPVGGSVPLRASMCQVRRLP